MNVLITDTETTGIDPKQNQIIEIGAILYSVKHRCVLQQMSTLLPCESNPVQHVNRIPAEASQEIKKTEVEMEFGDSWDITTAFFGWFNDVANGGYTDFVIAHNPDFDKDFIAASIVPRVRIPWIDTQDMKFAARSHVKKSISLVELALLHDIPVASAHRALVDCQLIASIFDRCSDDLEELIRRASQPKNLYIAQVSYANKDLAKGEGFIWDKLIRKQWAKKMFEEDIADLPFSVVEYQEPAPVAALF